MPEKLVVVHDERCRSHDTGDGHPEAADRLTVIRRRLEQGFLASPPRFVASRVAERRWLTTVHAENYLYRFEEAAMKGREYFGHPDNGISFYSFEAALVAAGAGLVGIDLLERDPTQQVFCCVRPPGHHAETALASGFCFFNNAAIAARYWQERYRRQRIMIVDWDAHHGNGIQSAFVDDPDVFYVSVHEDPAWSFPGSGHSEESGNGVAAGTILNVPLSPGAGDAQLLQAIHNQVEPAMESFRPEAVIVAAGFDGHVADDMSGLAYTTKVFRQLGVLAAAWGRVHCQGRLLTILEGGYHLSSLAAGVENYLDGLVAGDGG